MPTWTPPVNSTENPSVLPGPDPTQSVAGFKLFRHYKSRPVGRNVFIFSDNTASETDPDGITTLWNAADRTGDSINAKYVVRALYGGHATESLTTAEAAILTASGFGANVS